MREYLPIKMIKEQNPGVKGWILQTPAGASFILSPTGEEPTQRVCLLGILER